MHNYEYRGRWPKNEVDLRPARPLQTDETDGGVLSSSVIILTDFGIPLPSPSFLLHMAVIFLHFFFLFVSLFLAWHLAWPLSLLTGGSHAPSLPSVCSALNLIAVVLLGAPPWNCCTDKILRIPILRIASFQKQEQTEGTTIATATCEENKQKKAKKETTLHRTFLSLPLPSRDPSLPSLQVNHRRPGWTHSPFLSRYYPQLKSSIVLSTVLLRSWLVSGPGPPPVCLPSPWSSFLPYSTTLNKVRLFFPCISPFCFLPSHRHLASYTSLSRIVHSIITSTSTRPRLKHATKQYPSTRLRASPLLSILNDTLFLSSCVLFW